MGGRAANYVALDVAAANKGNVVLAAGGQVIRCKKSETAFPNYETVLKFPGKPLAEICFTVGVLEKLSGPQGAGCGVPVDVDPETGCAGGVQSGAQVGREVPIHGAIQPRVDVGAKAAAAVDPAAAAAPIEKPNGNGKTTAKVAKKPSKGEKQNRSEIARRAAATRRKNAKHAEA